MEFEAGSSVLFVGEGDFSFTEALSCHHKHASDITLVATGFHQDVTERANINIQKLKERGVEVVLGVDATKLHIDETLKSRKFTCVVFNFPHVGGKMKIHLNRTLLEEFFASAICMLTDHGNIIVSLCAGQGGVPIDSETRRWDDTWQLVLMASRADLILKRVFKFDASRYNGYSATGYRSLEKGFDLSKAITYVFERGPREIDPLHCDPLRTESAILYDGHCMNIPYFIYAQIQRNICSDLSTVPGQLCSLIQKHLSRNVILQFKDYILMDENTEFRNILHHYSGYLLSISSKVVSVYPVYILKKSPFSIDAFLLIMYNKKNLDFGTICMGNIELEIQNLSKSFSPYSKTLTWKDIMYDSSSVSVSDSSVSETSHTDYLGDLAMYAVDLNQLVKFCFDIDIDEFWAFGQHITTESHCFTYSPFSLFPLEYVYDLSFWQYKEESRKYHPPKGDSELPPTGEKEGKVTLDLNLVGTIIVNVAKDLLLDYKLLSSDVHPVKRRMSFTYRIRYRSFFQSLSDCRAKQIHTNIGLILEERLGVEIR
ncbi:uncharacterized protein [Palaemon carinicauda]